MDIATFGPACDLAGKKITREGAGFVLEGHGPISPAEIMEHDGLGRLVWANEGTRAWVGSLATKGTTNAAPSRFRQATFKFANYSGGMSSHPKPERHGTLVLSPDGNRWELHWGPGKKVYSHGGLASHALDIQATGPSSCHVLIRDLSNPSQAASIELPKTPAAELAAALAERESHLAPSRAKVPSAPSTPSAPSPAPASVPTVPPGENLRESTRRLGTVSADRVAAPKRRRIKAWQVAVLLVVAIVAVSAMWPRHHSPQWNAVAAIMNAPSCPDPLTNLTDADFQYMSFSDTFTLTSGHDMVQIFGEATNHWTDVSVSGFIVPANIPQDPTDINNSVSSCRSFAYSTQGSMYTYEVMPPGSYYVAALANGHSWNLFVSTQ
jgi:hypothetical protein